ncbi:Thioredoxin-like [Spirosomataceae bacterium TFI 002]|nr:Thioredoxin-like [Spirosomataceae bacterium TFI 002]
MKILLIFCLFFFGTSEWGNDFDSALVQAQSEHKLVLLNFSGSDWCSPCILLKRQVFANDEFIQFANEKLVTLRADFPRLKKNQLSKEDQKKNEELAEKYNPDGKFPFTLLLDEKGKVLKTWDGYAGKAEQTLEEIKAAVNG